MTKPLSMFVAATAMVCASSSCSSDVDEQGDATAPSSTVAVGTGVPADGSAGATATTVVSAKGEADTTEVAVSNPANAADPAAAAAANPNANQGVQAAADPATLDHTQDIRGNCQINSGYADDHACLPAPRPGEGIQIHIGPANYADPEEVAKYLMHPGEESSQCFTLRTPNAAQVIYQTSMLSGRAGTHHMINTVFEGELPTGMFGPCGGRSSETATPAGSLPGASKAYMPRSKVAPEYAHVGSVLVANALLQGDMHYFNFTDKDILREVWLNLYFPAPDATVTEYSKVIRGFGGVGWGREPIQPGTDMVYKYECPIVGNGNVLSLLGHYHAHGKQFTASIKRKSSGQSEKVFEMFDYLDPATYDYNSVTTNPTFSPNASGALSGILTVQDGDILQWDCHIINDGTVPLKYVNEVKTGEMCNIWGNSIGTETISCDMP